jgi:serine phosphatase RsbU (regulator of sigma subunit)/CHASE2 domain-containing sensor protein
MMGLKSLFNPGRRRRAWHSWAALLLLAVGLSLAIGQQTRWFLFDSWQRLSPRAVAADNVRVVLIDGESLTAVGPWPWPRYYLARLTEEIAKQDAKVIAFDVLFPESDRLRPELFAGLYPELSGPAASEITALPSMDALFGQVIGQAPVVLARAGALAGERDGRSLTVDAQLSGPLPRRIDRWPAAITAIPELEDAALGHGLVNGQPDGDGVIRAVPMVMEVAGRSMPGFALEIARLSLATPDIRTSPSTVQLAGRRIPIDPRGRMLLRFGDFPQDHIVSAAEVLGNGVPANYFRGKSVLIGLAAEGTSDIVATPLASENFGVIVQAQAVDSILTSRWLERPAWAPALEWALAAGLALLALLTAFRGHLSKAALAVAFVGLPLASWLAFDQMALLIDATRPLLVGGGAFAGVVVGLFADARHERERLREALVQERIAAAQTEGELQAARDIQMSMVPDRSAIAAVDPRLDADALLEPARSVGGDLIDLVRLDSDRVAFLIGDVTGKGVPSALFMAKSKALMSFVLSGEKVDLGGAVRSVNEELLRGGSDSLSVTIIIGAIDLATGAVSIICAGHEDPITLTAGGECRGHRLEGGPPMGLVDYPYPVERLDLAPGDMLILVTDGITEAQDRDGALYGRQRILSVIGAGGGSAGEMCEAIRDSVRAFEDGAEATDDLTVMVLRYLGPDGAQAA